MNDIRHRRWFQFSLKTLLLLMAVIAIFFAGHGIGFEQGYKQASDEYGGEPFLSVRVKYPVGDLVIPLDDPRQDVRTDAE